MLQALSNTPTLKLKTTRGTQSRHTDLPGLVALLAPYAGRQSRGIIKEAHALPGHGTRSMVRVVGSDGTSSRCKTAITFAEPLLSAKKGRP